MEMTSVSELRTLRLVSAHNPGCGDSSYDVNRPLNIDGVVEVIEKVVAHLELNRLLHVRSSFALRAAKFG